MQNVQNLITTHSLEYKLTSIKIFFSLSFLFPFFFTAFLRFYFGKQTFHNQKIYQFDFTFFIEIKYKLKNLKNLINTNFPGYTLKKTETSRYSRFSRHHFQIPGYSGFSGCSCSPRQHCSYGNQSINFQLINPLKLDAEKWPNIH